jgi:hypothetical protein
MKLNEICMFVGLGINGCARECCSSKQATISLVAGGALLIVSAVAFAALGSQKGWWNAHTIERIFNGHAKLAFGLTFGFGLPIILFSALSLRVNQRYGKLLQEHLPFIGQISRVKPDHTKKLHADPLDLLGKELLVKSFDEKTKCLSIQRNGVLLKVSLPIDEGFVKACFIDQDFLKVTTRKSILLYDLTTTPPQRVGKFHFDQLLEDLGQYDWYTRTLPTRGFSWGSAIWCGMHVIVYQRDPHSIKKHVFEKVIQDVQERNGTLFVLTEGNQLYKLLDKHFIKVECALDPQKKIILKTRDLQTCYTGGKTQYFSFQGREYLIGTKTLTNYHAPLELVIDGSGEISQTCIFVYDLQQRKNAYLAKTGPFSIDERKGNLVVYDSGQKKLVEYSLEKLYGEHTNFMKIDLNYQVISLEEIEVKK